MFAGGLAAVVGAPAAAHAAIAVQRLAVTPASLRAGEHARLDVHAEFSTDDPLRGLTLHLPPGLLADARSVARCPQRRFETASCPADTRVGSATLVTTLPLAGTFTGSAFALEPSAGELARVGLAVAPVVAAPVRRLVVRAALRPDGGLDATVDGIPTDAGAVRSLDLRLGDASAPAFVRIPTSCDAATTTADAVAASGAHGSASTAFTPAGCEGLAFTPRLSAELDRRGPPGARDKPALRTVIAQPRSQAGIRGLGIVLPPRLALDLATPPPAAPVGTIVATSPLLAAPITGSLSAFARPDTPLPGLRLALGPPLGLAVDGATELTTGLTASFGGLPDLPLDRLALTFAGAGPLKLLGDPCRGAPLTLGSALAGHNGATAAVPARVRVRGCPATLRATLSGGRRPQLRVVARRGRDAGALWRLVLRLPRGLRADRRGGRVRVLSGGKRIHPAFVRVQRRRITVRLRRARFRLSVVTPGGVLRGRPRGRLTVAATAGDGRVTRVRLRPRPLR